MRQLEKTQKSQTIVLLKSKLCDKFETVTCSKLHSAIPFICASTPMAYLCFAHQKKSRPCVLFSAQDSWTTYRSRLLSIKLELEGAALEACYQHDNGFNFRASACSLESILEHQADRAICYSGQSICEGKQQFVGFLERRQKAFCARAEGGAGIKSVVCAKCKSA